MSKTKIPSIAFELSIVGDIKHSDSIKRFPEREAERIIEEIKEFMIKNKLVKIDLALVPVI